MMIDKRLIKIVEKSKKYVTLNVLSQWISLVANIVMMFAITKVLGKLYDKTLDKKDIIYLSVVVLFCLLTRMICYFLSSRMSYLSSKEVKITFRKKIYRKLLSLGSSYRDDVNTSEIVQVAVEGVDQLETYFGSYLPQFFYSMLAPVTLFCVLAPINFPSAIILLLCVPLIPISIAVVMTWAKKLLSKYWGQYTALGDTFLENLQGLTTLKIYQSDEFKHEKMNEESEKFRKITMKVLAMQLNSITIMDVIAYGGAAIGSILAVYNFKTGNIDLSGCILIILLSAEFFLPMRLLGSFFHIAMNGMAASGKIFKLLDITESEDGEYEFKMGDIEIRDVNFSYEEDKEVLHRVNMKLEHGKFTAIVGESGCGKSTTAAILMKKNKNYYGSIKISGIELSKITEKSIMENITYIGHNSYLFKGTVRENLLIAKPNSTDDELSSVLKRAKLFDFLQNENGLDTLVSEKGENLSGGQCQRLALARALLHNTPVYIFDEATSNIDLESEEAIMNEIHNLAKYKTVIMISHRLVNVKNSDVIYVMDKGRVIESGSHELLLDKGCVYASLWETQQELECYNKEENHETT